MAWDAREDMPIKTALGCQHITPVGGNIFLDLGFPPDEAAALKHEADRRIGEEQRITRQLTAELARWVKDQGSDGTAHARLGIGERELRRIVAGKRCLRIGALISLLIRAGRQLEVSVS